MQSSDFPNRKTWSLKQDQALRALVQRQGLDQGREYYDQGMLEEYGLINRSAEECFERWHEHFSEERNQEEWSPKELEMLFEAHQKFGNKWKEISKHLEKRTQNETKNKFYSTIRKRLRKISKRAGIKNSTSLIRQLKPHLLSQFLSLIQVQNPELLKLLASAEVQIQEHYGDNLRIEQKSLLNKLNQLVQQNQNIQREQYQQTANKAMRVTRSRVCKTQEREQAQKKSKKEHCEDQEGFGRDEKQRKRECEQKSQIKIDGLGMDFEMQESDQFPLPEIIAKKSNQSGDMNELFERFEMDSPFITFSTPFRPSPSPRWGYPQHEGNRESFSKQNLDHIVEETKKRVNNTKE